MSLLQNDFADEILPYLERHDIYKLFREVATDLVISTPADHVKHIKTYLVNLQKGLIGKHRIMLLVPDNLKVDKSELARCIGQELNLYVVVRAQVFENYLKHLGYNRLSVTCFGGMPASFSKENFWIAFNEIISTLRIKQDIESKACYLPNKLAIVTKDMITGDHAEICGWLMFDTPCSLVEARSLQREGVLPSVTLQLVVEGSLEDEETFVPFEEPKSCHEQDIRALAWAYKHTLKKVIISPQDPLPVLAAACVAACLASGPPAYGPIRLALLGPKGSGRNTLARDLANHFNLVHVNFKYLYEQAKLAKTEEGERLRKHGPNVEDLAAISNRRLLEKDCVCKGWVLTNYPNTEEDFERLRKLKTPPNRIIFLDLGRDLCEKRLVKDLNDSRKTIVFEELSRYFAVLPKLCAAAGTMGIEVNARVAPDDVLVALQTALLAPTQ